MKVNGEPILSYAYNPHLAYFKRRPKTNLETRVICDAPAIKPKRPIASRKKGQRKS